MDFTSILVFLIALGLAAMRSPEKDGAAPRDVFRRPFLIGLAIWVLLAALQLPSAIKEGGADWPLFLVSFVLVAAWAAAGALAGAAIARRRFQGRS